MSRPDRSPTDVSADGRHARERGDPPEAKTPIPQARTRTPRGVRGYAMPDREGAPQADSAGADGAA